VSTTTVASNHQGSTSACSLVTPAQIESTLGRRVGTPVAANSISATACTYPGVTGGKENSVIIAYRGRVSAASAVTEQAALAKLHGTTTPVTVSSGQAYYYSVPVGGQTITSLVTLVGTTQVAITSTATADQLENLSKLAFASLRSATTTTTTPAGPTTTVAG
jgi:hypothetical protein